MRIRMRTLAAGPSQVLLAGKEYEVDSAQARDLIAGGYAELAGGAAATVIETAAKGPKETAARTGRPAPNKPTLGKAKAENDGE